MCWPWGFEYWAFVCEILQQAFPSEKTSQNMDADKVETLRQNAAVIALPFKMAEKLNREKQNRETTPKK